MAASRPVPQACWISNAGVSRDSVVGQHRFAHQIEIAGVLHHGAAHYVAQALAMQVESVDQPLEGCGQHLLVGRGGVHGVGSGKRNAVAAENGDATDGGGVLSFGCGHGVLSRWMGFQAATA
jgi:hypothetical protein